MSRTSHAWWTPGFARAYIVTMRPYLLFVSGAAGIVGLSFSYGMSQGRIAIGFVALFLSYGFGQALTDCFQTDTDSLSAPYRPLVRGEVTRRQVLIVSLAGLTIVVGALCYLNPWILTLGVAAVLGLLTYTFFKRRWWGGPPWNSWIVALLPMMGWLAGGGRSLASLGRFLVADSGTFLAAVLAVFAGYANFVVMGYFKDISADRETGYETFPVVFGWQPAAVYGDVTAALAAGLSLFVIVQRGAGAWSIALLAVGLAMHVYAQVAVHRSRDERAVGGPIAYGVRALLLYCMAMAVANHPSWLVALLLFGALFEFALRLRPDEGQV
ncbi:MAG: UbiA family prenyltransferase [Candidatus Eisenbacteria bacterium]